MKNPELYPQTKDIKTLENILEDIDKNMIITIFDETKPLNQKQILFTVSHKVERIKQYIKVITGEIIAIKEKL